MNTLTSPSLAARLGLRTQPAATERSEGGRGLAALMLAAVLAALVVLAERLINTWTDGHLLLMWVALWVVVFAGLALFASAARQLARRAQVSLDGWSRTLAEARADARMWEMAQSDPRLLTELRVALDRKTAEPTEPVDFSAALAPMGMNMEPALPAESGWDRYVARMVAQRARSSTLFYI